MTRQHTLHAHTKEAHPVEKPSAVTAAYLSRGAFLAALVLVLAPVPSRGGGFSNLEVLVGSRLALFAAFVLSSVALTVGCRQSTSAPTERWIVGAAVLQFVGGLGYPLVNTGLLPQGFLTADLVMQGIALPVLNAAWGRAYARLDSRRCMGLTAGSLGVAAVLVGLYHGMPQGFSWCVSLLLPLAAIPLLWLLRGDTSSWRRAPAAVRALRPTWRFLVGTLCAFAAANVMAGSAETGGFIEFGAIIAGVALASALLGIMVVVERYHRVNLIAVDSAVLLVLALGYTASGLLIGQSGAQEFLKAFQHCSVIALEQCMMALTWLIVLDSSRRTRVNPAFTVSASFLAVFAGKGAGSLAGMVMPLDPAALSILALFLFVPAMLFLGTDAFVRNAGIEKDTQPEAIAADLQAFAAAYGLSPREQEVLELWTAGNRIDYVAEQLCISKNTAKTHVTHIYRKTGTANREELLEALRRG